MTFADLLDSPHDYRTHVLFHSEEPEADRAFIRDVLGFRAVDAGEGWLIFALPPAEAGIHPTEDESRGQIHGGRHLLGAAVYLMCDVLQLQIRELESKKIVCSPIEKAPWGMETTLLLPSGGELGLYQPRHPTAFNLGSK